MKKLLLVIVIACISVIGNAQNLHAAFSCDPDSSGFNPYLAACEYKFVDQITGNPVSWLWIFDSNYTSSSQNPHYGASPTQWFMTSQITLIVQDSIGNRDTAYYSLYNDTACSCNNISGIREYNKKNIPLTISPNPFHTSALLQINANFETINFRIYNSIGILEKQDKIPASKKYVLYRNDLLNGMYFLQAINARGQMTFEKFIVE